MLQNEGMKCPKCNSTSHRKNGRRRGKQCYQCCSYGRQFVESPKFQPYSEEIKQLCLKMYLNGLYTIEHLDDGAGILAIDETGFLKKGQESAGVSRQYCGLTGQIENCQVGVFMAYLSSRGQALIDRPVFIYQNPGVVRQQNGRKRCDPAEVSSARERAPRQRKLRKKPSWPPKPD